MTPSELLTRADALLALAQSIQTDELFDDEPGRKALTAELDKQYLAWYRDGLTLFARFNRLDLQQKFMQEYEGNFLAARIRKFLKLGWKIYNLYNPQKGDLISSIKWTVKFETGFKEPLQIQCNYLAAL